MPSGEGISSSATLSQGKSHSVRPTLIMIGGRQRQHILTKSMPQSAARRHMRESAKS